MREQGVRGHACVVYVCVCVCVCVGGGGGGRGGEGEEGVRVKWIILDKASFIFHVQIKTNLLTSISGVLNSSSWLHRGSSSVM